MLRNVVIEGNKEINNIMDKLKLYKARQTVTVSVRNEEKLVNL